MYFQWVEPSGDRIQPALQKVNNIYSIWECQEFIKIQSATLLCICVDMFVKEGKLEPRQLLCLHAKRKSCKDQIIRWWRIHRFKPPGSITHKRNIVKPQTTLSYRSFHHNELLQLDININLYGQPGTVYKVQHRKEIRQKIFSNFTIYSV